MKNVNTNSRLFNRYLAAVALLFTLFISSGEGVRLFPIPVDQDATTGTSDVVFHDKDSYSVGIQTGRNLSQNQRTKHAGSLKVDAAGSPQYFFQTEIRVSYIPVRTADFSTDRTFRIDPPIASHAGRAPPIV